jgi:hypothetical protein
MTTPSEPGPPNDLEDIAEALGDSIGARGFCLLVFPLGGSNEPYAYASNASRTAVTAMLKDFLKELEQGGRNGSG